MANAQFEVWRVVTASGSHATLRLVAITPLHAIAANVLNTIPLNPPIAVQAGDLLGVRGDVNFKCILPQVPENSGSSAVDPPNVHPPVPGDEGDFTAVPGFQMNLGVQFVADSAPPTCLLTATHVGPPAASTSPSATRLRDSVRIAVTSHVNANCDRAGVQRRQRRPACRARDKDRPDETLGGRAACYLRRRQRHELRSDSDDARKRDRHGQRFTDVPAAEHVVTVTNGTPGLRSVTSAAARRPLPAPPRSWRHREIDLSRSIANVSSYALE